MFLIWRQKTRQIVGGYGKITGKLVADTDSGLVEKVITVILIQLLIIVIVAVAIFSSKRQSV
jgi:hypothetical protein